MKTLILGLGNLLMGDEGVGVHAVNALMQDGLQADVTALDVGTAILDALPALEESERVIVLDAVRTGRKPGTICRIRFDDLVQPKRIASMHGFDLTRVVALSERRDSIEVVVIGVEPARIEWSMELSPEVEKALPKLLDAVRTEVERK